MVRKLFLVLFFSAQCFGILYARFTRVRYFCWAPYDQLSNYEIQVRLPRGMLSTKEVHARYHIPAKGRENRSIDNIKTLIQRYEGTYGKGDHAEIILYFDYNGKPQPVWSWKNP